MKYPPRVKTERVMNAIYATRPERFLEWLVGRCYRLSESGVFGWLGDRADDLRVRSQERRQRTFVYCPSCEYELCAGGDWMGSPSHNSPVEVYKCARCGTFSSWDFDAPVPLLLKVGSLIPSNHSDG